MTYTIQIINNETGKSAACDILEAHAPSLRSTLADHANELGERSSGSHVYDKEDAITRAQVAFNTIRATFNKVIEREDPHYE